MTSPRQPGPCRTLAATRFGSARFSLTLATSRTRRAVTSVGRGRPYVRGHEANGLSIGSTLRSLSGVRLPGLAQANACNRAVVTIHIDSSTEDINWAQAKADLAADNFDNGRTPEALRRSFRESQHVAFARDGDRVVGMARLLSDGVCNAYLLDVWTASAYRRQGIASGMIRQLLERVPGQHVGLQTDDAQAFYESLGFRAQPEFWSLVVGSWLDNDANR